MNNSFKTLISIVSIIIMIVFGYLLNDNKNLKLEIKNKELVIVQLEGKVTDQESKIRILTADNDSKKIAIASLEQRARESSLAAQEAVDRMLELAKIERGVSPASGPDKSIIKNPGEQIPPKNESSEKADTPNPAAGKENSIKADVVNDSSSKKFIELRNNIYNRYK